VLGSAAEADDAVQEAWLRLNRSDTTAITNLSGWLTTVVSRVALDHLRSRSSRREDAVGAEETEPASPLAAAPEHQALAADAVGPALLMVLDTLAPAERLAFVLHDVFAVPFDEIATVLGRSPNAAKQLASRARRRIQGAERQPEQDTTRQRVVVDAFLAASRGGDFAALLSVLHPDVVLRADAAGAAMGAPEVVLGSTAVAGVFCGRALGAQGALIDGSVGFAWIVDGTPKVVWDVTIADGVVTRIDMVAAVGSLADIDLQLL
jgi:RNA polymerase sigma-70 factor (ECF subfamily)